jgi:hypothetical protein
MNRYKRSLAITLIAIAVVLAFLAGFITTSGSLAFQPIEASPSALTTAQWASVQASNFLLMGGFSIPSYLPLVFR